MLNVILLIVILLSIILLSIILLLVITPRKTAKSLEFFSSTFNYERESILYTYLGRYLNKLGRFILDYFFSINAKRSNLPSNSGTYGAKKFWFVFTIFSKLDCFIIINFFATKWSSLPWACLIQMTQYYKGVLFLIKIDCFTNFNFFTYNKMVQLSSLAFLESFLKLHCFISKNIYFSIHSNSLA